MLKIWSDGFGCRDNSWDIFVIILVLIWIHFFEYEQADLLGSAFLSDNSEAV